MWWKWNHINDRPGAMQLFPQISCKYSSGGSTSRLSKKAVMEKVLGWALNILDALRYIHGEEFARRDLELYNILVSSCRGFRIFLSHARVRLISLLFTFWFVLEMTILTFTSKYLD